MKYFIDCGTSLFEGLEKFNSFYHFDTSWKIDSFEANPLTYETALKRKPNYPNLNFQNKAVWIHDNTVNVNINDKLPLDNGTNILENPPDRDIQYNRKFNWTRKLSVPAVDLARVICSSNDDVIVVKLDIEGAEFEVLEHLIKTNAVKKISNMYVEFHERFFINDVEKYRQKKYELIQRISELNVNVSEWE
jgi:FkbM family methyltransferase